MSLPDLYVMRHGETEWNRQGRMQGVMDSPLTARGAAQADAMGQLLHQLGIEAQGFAFLTSPQGRAMETARRALAPIGASARPDPLLREIAVGDWTGLSRDEIAANWPSSDPHEHFLDFYARAPGGESFDAMWDRVGQVLDNLSQPTVIVTHGITSRFLRTRAMGFGLDRLAELPGGQGVIHVVRDGVHKTLSPDAN